MSLSAQNTNSVNEVNFCDPVVRFDPTFARGVVAKGMNDSAGAFGQNDPEQDTVKVDGVRFPVLLINNSVIPNGDIISLDLLFIKFLPEIHVKIRDDNYIKSTSDLPGLNNIITCIITMPGPLTYKKISLNFYIYDFLDYTDDGLHVIEYSGRFYIKEFEKIQHKQVKRVDGSDASSDELSTYEMLYSIAKETGLGFASDDSSKGVRDNRYRLCQAKKYADFIQQELNYSGTDESSFLDAWIDPYGYITLVDLPYLFGVYVSVSDLSIQALNGVTTENVSTPEQTWVETDRVITNHPEPGGASSLSFLNYQEYINNDVQKTGVTKHYYSMTIRQGAQTPNAINQYDVQFFGSTTDERVFDADYTCFESWFFPGIEMGEKNVIKQKALRTAYFEKKQMRVMVVTLNQPNLGIQRGTLLYVMIYETDQFKKLELNNLADSLENNGSGEYSDTALSANVEAIKSESGGDSPVFNFALSDFYYVNGIEFVYQDEMIQQKLFLIKKGDYIQTRGVTTPNKIQS
jgi:hypothetical protein